MELLVPQHVSAPTNVPAFLAKLWKMVSTKNLYENRMCNQWDNWRAYGPELLL